MTSFLSNFLLCFQEKINSKKLCKNKSFTLMKNLCNLVSWELNPSAQPHCCSCHQQHVPSCYPLETVSSVGWGSNFSLFHLICKGCQWCCSGLTVETAGRWTQTSFPTHEFCKVYHLSVLWKMHRLGMRSSPMPDLLSPIKWSQIRR